MFPLIFAVLRVSRVGTSFRLSYQSCPGLFARRSALSLLSSNSMSVRRPVAWSMQMSFASSHTWCGVQGSPACAEQLPPAQVSLPLQKIPSLQGAVLLAWTQPDVGLQESSVQGLWSSQTRGVPTRQPTSGSQVSRPLQTLPSSQTRGGPPRQTPPEQASYVVQALPSSQGAVLLTWVQTPATQ